MTLLLYWTMQILILILILILIPVFQSLNIIVLQAGQVSLREVTHSSSLNFVPYFENVIKKNPNIAST
jgi:hypothetical protein